MTVDFLSYPKVLWHCLFRMLKGCCVCYTAQRDVSGKLVTCRWFCSCGYLNEGVTWEQHKERVLGIFSKVDVKEVRR